MVIIQVVPALPPAIDGLGDYALNLARQLRQGLGKETHFVVGNPTWEGERMIEGFPITVLPKRSGTAVLSSLLKVSSRPAPVLLHYVGYGYAKRGCPLWLVDGLQRWQTTDVNRFLVTMFHELYAFGPPWTSSFWLSPLQKNLAIRLADLSDRILTSRQGYAKRLYELSRGKHPHIPTLPVFSNIGEPKQVPPLAKRDRRIVVFGSPGNRLRVYRESLAELELTCQLLGIEEIWDIGSRTNLTVSTANGVPIMELGELSAAEISSLLLNSFAGFFNYTPEYLAKSTIFAAYCAHGLLPVSHVGSTFSVDGIIAGKHYWIPGNQAEDLNRLEALQAIAENAYLWYQSHRLLVQAKTFADLLGNITTA
jgi:hypothetical protein